jgi:hypothetical protein
METSTASLLLAGVSAAMALVALVRTRHVSKFNIQMQHWTWRQKFLQNLAHLANQLTKADILLTQQLYRLHALEESVRQIHPTWSSELCNYEMLVTGIAEAKVDFAERQSILREFSEVLERAWRLTNPDSELDSEIHRFATRIEGVISAVSEISVHLDKYASHLAPYTQPRVEA